MANEGQTTPQSSHMWTSCLYGQEVSLHAPLDSSTGQILTMIEEGKVGRWQRRLFETNSTR
jgi:hypothetical protein